MSSSFAARYGDLECGLGEGPKYGVTTDRPYRRFFEPVGGGKAALSRSASVPSSSPLACAARSAQAQLPGGDAWRKQAQGILLEERAHEGSMGVKVCGFHAKLQAQSARERLADALEDGEPRELRKAVRHATARARMGDEPAVQRAQATLCKLEKAARECRDGIAQGNLLTMQRGVAAATQLGIGPRAFEDPCLAQARREVANWSLYVTYLRGLDASLQEGVRPACERWVMAVEGGLLSPEFEELATAQLAQLPGADSALEEVLGRPQLRLQYAAPWKGRQRLVAMVQRRLSELGVRVQDLTFRPARVQPQGSAPSTASTIKAGIRRESTSSIVAGRMTAAAALAAAARDTAEGEGHAGGGRGSAEAGIGGGRSGPGSPNCGGHAVQADDAGEVVDDGAGDAEASTCCLAIVIEGSRFALSEVERLLEAAGAEEGEPVALGFRSQAERPAQRGARAEMLRSRLASAAQLNSTRKPGGMARGAQLPADAVLRPWYAMCPPREAPLPLLDPQNGAPTIKQRVGIVPRIVVKPKKR